MSVLASRLTERITIEQPNRTPDTYGGNAVSWTEVATLYAAVQPLMGTAREISRADQRQAIAGYRITIRKRDDVDASMREQWNGRTLLIHSLHETRETLELLTYEEMA